MSTRISAFFSRKAKQFANDDDKMTVMMMMIELFKDVGLLKLIMKVSFITAKQS